MSGVIGKSTGGCDGERAACSVTPGRRPATASSATTSCSCARRATGSQTPRPGSPRSSRPSGEPSRRLVFERVVGVRVHQKACLKLVGDTEHAGRIGRARVDFDTSRAMWTTSLVHVRINGMPSEHSLIILIYVPFRLHVGRAVFLHIHGRLRTCANILET